MRDGSVLGLFVGVWSVARPPVACTSVGCRGRAVASARAAWPGVRRAFLGLWCAAFPRACWPLTIALPCAHGPSRAAPFDAPCVREANERTTSWINHSGRVGPGTPSSFSTSANPGFIMYYPHGDIITPSWILCDSPVEITRRKLTSL